MVVEAPTYEIDVLNFQVICNIISPSLYAIYIM